MTQSAWYWARLHILGGARGVGYYYIDPQRGRSFQLVVPMVEDLPADEVARRARAAGYGASAPGFALGGHEELRSSPHLPPTFLELTRAEFAQGDPNRAMVLELTTDEIAAYGLPPAPPWVRGAPPPIT